MIVVLQRVARAGVRVDGADVAAIGRGLCLLVCAVAGDTAEQAGWLADKIATLRVFPDAAGATNLGPADVGAAVLLVPQFTLAADWRKGRRPSFTSAAAPPQARPLLAALQARLEGHGLPVVVAPFGASMAVELVNDGPFTLVLDSRERSAERRS